MVVEGLVVEHDVQRRGGDRADADGVDPHPGGEVAGGEAGVVRQRRLGGAVGRAARPLTRPMTDEMLTTDPCPLSSSDGSAARVRAWAVETLKWNASSRCRGDVWEGGHAAHVVDHDVQPAERLAGRPARPATAPRSARSASTATARRPAFSTWATTSASCDPVRDDITTSAPASASATAVAAPMPRPPPVTTATRSVTRNFSRIMAGH